MKEFKMTTQDNEVIKITKAESLEEAIQFFSDLKKLNQKDFLKIFKVIEV